MLKGFESEELEELAKLLADFEGLSHAVEGHANYYQLLGDHPTAESSVSNSKRVAKEAWQLFHLLGEEEPPAPFGELGTLKVQVAKTVGALVVSIYVLDRWLYVLNGDPLMNERVIN